MSEFIILTKIAKLANDKQISNKATTFNFKNREWVFLDAYKNDTENIINLLKISTRLFECIPLDEHLVIIFKQSKNRERKQNFGELYDKLFGLIFPTFKTNLPYTKDNNLLKTYVTTKLFEALQSKHDENLKDLTNNVMELPLPNKFLPKLCEYQKRSVLWLLKKERDCEYFAEYFEKLVAKDNESIVYKHLYSRFVQTEPPKIETLPPGGILADEMGLGKTVEMLALILLNPRRDANLSLSMEHFFTTALTKRICVETKVFCVCTSNSKKEIIQCTKCNFWQHFECVAAYNEEMPDEGPYFCPSCWQKIITEYGLLKTKATFIVSPNTIKMQWVSEIRCHIQPSLKVFVYDGSLKGKWISPRQLAQYDVVLTDYNILRTEIYFTKDNTSQCKTRNGPRFMRVNTPILMLEWWRVLLDEAQMVESNTSNVTVVARQIPALNRWAVSGTPIQKSLHDLCPLLKFIGFEAVSEASTWNYLVNDFLLHHEQYLSNKTYPDLINVLQKCMWRTCKNQIESELKIPPQQEVMHLIQFSNLEKLFYNEQHAECYSNFLTNVQKYTKNMTTISPQVMRIILQPFLKIRQSCTIPVVVSNVNANNNFTTQQQKQFLQPKELHDYLKNSNEISCKAELRSVACCHNGLAALYFLKEIYTEAIKNYETVLKLASDYNHMNITVDSLLQIHALHNIMQIKIIHPEMVVNSFESYESQYNALEWKYLSTYANNLTNVKTSFTSAVSKIDTEITKEFMITMIECLQNINAVDFPLLIQKIQEECLPRFGVTNSKLVEIKSITSLIFVIELWFNKLKDILKTLLDSIEELSYFNDNVRSRNQVSPATWRNIMQLVNTVYDCHLSEIRDINKSTKDTQKPKKGSEKKEICKMCHIQNDMNTFECLLFDKVIDKDTNFTEGLQNPSFEMCICKIIIHFIKTKYHDLSHIERNWMYLENLQLVCKRLIKLWIEMEYTIKAYDELNMCKMRISLTNDPNDKSIFKIMECEINGRMMEQKSELMNAQSKFTAKLARLRYIKHLEIANDPGPCPICQLKEDDRYAVLECGHHICFPCLKSIRIYAKGFHLKCSICRNIQQNKNIYYVSRSKIKPSDSEKIKGDYSSKITCIVRLISQLKKQQDVEVESNRTLEVEKNDIKILIFSQWEPIIAAIASALKENDIKYRSQCTPKSIEEFKNPNLGITCLLMPFVRGSKGLNLVEATHVFLVEPILNPAEELQAIGRVHRFGQKRPTTVHRFIVSNSIEENIYNFIVSTSSNKSSSSTDVQRRWEFDNLSLKDFENLFSLQQPGECD